MCTGGSSGKRAERLLAPRIAIVALLIALCIAFTLSGGARRFLPPLVDRLRGLGWRGAILYGALYFPAALLMLPSSPITMGAGYLFGFVPGLLLGAPCTALCAALTMLVARSLGRPLAERLAARLPKFNRVAAAIERDGFPLIVLLRITPLIPFPIFNWALGLTRLGAVRFALASLLGMLPGNIVYAWLGSRAPEASALLRDPAALLGARPLLVTGLLVAFTALELGLASHRLARALQQAALENSVRDSSDRED